IGEVVYTSSISKGQNTVQIGELSAGVYMAEVSNSKLRLTERLVVVK
ncbi:MAG: hypothetical protein JNK66_14640, partial [Chitinophagales bacterium]|nr:hypothetical protein [Chitinophagales bacterium]MBL7779515.1 hypothetical protein [Chitinophagales bacterium]